MRNYDFRPDLRPAATDNEPELQWLEDSINYLFGLTFFVVREFFKLAFSFVCGIFRLFKKTRL